MATLEDVLTSQYELVNYHPYPTGHLSNTEIAFCENARQPLNQEQKTIADFVRKIDQQAREKLGIKQMDSKSAVELLLENGDTVYACVFGDTRSVTTAVENRGSTPMALKR